MSIIIQPRAIRRKNKPPIFVLSLLILCAVVLISIYYYPSFKQVSFNESEEIVLYFMGEAWNESAIYKEAQLYLPLSFFTENIDSNIQWDEKNKQIIITTEENIYQFPLGIKEGFANFQPYTMTYPVINRDELIYLPAEPIKDLYNLEILENKDKGLVSIYDKKVPYQKGTLINSVKLREKPSHRSPWVFQLSPTDEIRVVKEVDGWCWIETDDGRIGYVDESDIVLTGIEVSQIKNNIFQPFNPLGEPIFLTWEHVGQVTPTFGSIGSLSGVQVVSPTWFHLQADGMVVNKADVSFVQEAHKKGMQVWALFDNAFDPDMTHIFLNDSVLRVKAIKQILSYVDLYELDGINIDFENMYIEDKGAFVQFIRELAPVLHEKDRTLSIDVTFHSKSENWSMCYDREKLAKIADYIIVMGYDEHHSTSSIAGSVSSIPWVEKGLDKILEEVPQDKLILGIPYYTRLWSETTNENGEKIVSNKTMSMNQAERWLEETGATVIIDEQSGQHYVEMQKDNILYKMWLEDTFSLEKRMNLMKKYRLAGIAAWKRGLEKEDTWTFIKNNMGKR